MHLRCYCTPTVSFLLHHCMILRIYDATVRRLAVLFYTTVHFYASTFLGFTLLLHNWMILCIYNATVRRLAVLFYTTV